MEMVMVAKTAITFLLLVLQLYLMLDEASLFLIQFSVLLHIG